MELIAELMLAASKGKITILCCKKPALAKMTPWMTKLKILAFSMSESMAVESPHRACQRSTLQRISTLMEVNEVLVPSSTAPLRSISALKEF